jgi:hypothetical protein
MANGSCIRTDLRATVRLTDPLITTGPSARIGPATFVSLGPICRASNRRQFGSPVPLSGRTPRQMAAAQDGPVESHRWYAWYPVWRLGCNRSPWRPVAPGHSRTPRRAAQRNTVDLDQRLTHTAKPWLRAILVGWPWVLGQDIAPYELELGRPGIWLRMDLEKPPSTQMSCPVT